MTISTRRREPIEAQQLQCWWWRGEEHLSGVQCPVLLWCTPGIDQSGIPGNWNLLSENIVNSHLTAAAISANMNGMYCKLHKRNITWIIWTWTIFNCNLIGIEATLHSYMIWMKDDILVCRRSFNSYYDLSRSLSSVSVDQTRYKSRDVRRRMRKPTNRKCGRAAGTVNI